MKIPFKSICLSAVIISCFVLNAHAAGTGVLNLVKPVVPPKVVGAVNDGSGKLICENGLILQKNGQCCPPGTSNNFWDMACTPPGIIDGQIFNENDTTQYCPSADMFIVSDKNRHWFSCAASDSTAFYTDAKQSEGSKFCRDHGYGYLIKIKPKGTVGCVKVGDSQGDGCIEAGTCSFGSGK